ncbi:hypothetical protein CSPX01_00025 [Colletotrichum filicis]|nr:hypothetical protein CSPX01_00025 [Colletotrichum filicis]
MMGKIDTGGRCVRSSGGGRGGLLGRFEWFVLLCDVSRVACVCCLFLVAMEEYCRY